MVLLPVFLCYAILAIWQFPQSSSLSPKCGPMYVKVNTTFPIVLLFVLIIGLNYIENVRKIGSVLCICFVFIDSIHLPQRQPSQRTLNQSVSNGSVTLLNLKRNHHDYDPFLSLPSYSQK